MSGEGKSTAPVYDVYQSPEKRFPVHEFQNPGQFHPWLLSCFLHAFNFSSSRIKPFDQRIPPSMDVLWQVNCVARNLFIVSPVGVKVQWFLT